MDVFIGNLPADATLLELQELVGDFALRADFRCKQGHDRDGRPYHFFIARTENRSHGMELVARLNGLDFQGLRLAARECMPRQPGKAWPGEERRINPWPAAAAESG